MLQSSVPSAVIRLVGSTSTKSTSTNATEENTSAAGVKFIDLDEVQKRKLQVSINDAVAKPGSEQVPVCSLPNKAAFQPQVKVPRSRAQELTRTYFAFSKFRLSALVMSTAAGAYAVAPGVFEPLTFTACCLGTLLLSASANTWNQMIEVNADGQMKRTSNRPLVTGNASRTHACLFAVGTAGAGATLLAAFTNELTLALGVANLLLYVCAYTPLKRVHYGSMYVGSLVGAVPPMMGWAAACGGSLLSDSLLASLGAMVMPAVLFSWQFPHFNALSWNQRDDYARAGYRIMACEAPQLARRTALSHSVLLTAVCAAAPLTGVTTPLFAALTAPVNLYLLYLATRFYRQADSQSSRRLFRFSLLYLPVVLLAMLATRSASASDNEKAADDRPAALDA